MTASTILSFAALAFACVACLFLGLYLLRVAIGWRRLCREIERDGKNGYKLPAEAMPQPRPCPRWMRSETGRAAR